MDSVALIGSAAGLGILAGVRLYFTVFALGLAIRMGWFEPQMAGANLHMLASTPLLVTSGVLLVAEFVADKIPWFDSMWDAVHTFIRPVGAAALGMTALGSFDPATTAVIGLVSGGAAFSGHASKAAARAAVNHSPEPFSNWALSFAEDLVTPIGLWLVVEHPWVAGALALAFLIVFAVVARVVWKAFRSIFGRLRRALEPTAASKV